ncbi:MAG TPA: helix-turn-helix domain-containing protein [Gemmataceae bacterium]|nr:helix-turn-helix domain-containing protein [Gemmataceae bacterium]
MKTYTVIQAAQELQVSPTLVYALVAAGAIEHERHGLGRGTIRITEAALDEYRQRKTRKAKRESVPLRDVAKSPKAPTFKHLELS